MNYGRRKLRAELRKLIMHVGAEGSKSREVKADHFIEGSSSMFCMLHHALHIQKCFAMFRNPKEFPALNMNVAVCRRVRSRLPYFLYTGAIEVYTYLFLLFVVPFSSRFSNLSSALPFVCFCTRLMFGGYNDQTEKV
jgi:hypothetical protein